MVSYKLFILIILFNFGIILAVLFAFSINSSFEYAQQEQQSLVYLQHNDDDDDDASTTNQQQLSLLLLPQLNKLGVKITSPVTGQQVAQGVLTIFGISTDNSTTDCQVFADWNNLKPMQKVMPTGPGGENDYSSWTFTYTNKYHLITQGANELTAKLSCVTGPFNSTKYYTIKVQGILSDNIRPWHRNHKPAIGVPMATAKNDNNKEILRIKMEITSQIAAAKQLTTFEIIVISPNWFKKNGVWFLPLYSFFI